MKNHIRKSSAARPQAGERLPVVRRKGRKVIRTVSPATGEVLEWNPTRRTWIPEGSAR